MRILVTGGTGYIGSHTCVTLLDAGHEVAILDNLCNSSIEVIHRIKKISNRNLIFYQVDVGNKQAVEVVFDSFHPEVVIHFAALKAVGDSLRNPLTYYQSNVSGSMVLFNVMQNKNIKKLVFSSSANVYGDARVIPVRENVQIAPTNPYGQTKAMVEQILADIVISDSEWRVARLRYFNPMGAHESGLIGEDPNGLPSNLPPYISQVAVGKLESLKIFGGDYPTPDGTGVRDYIHVMDLASGHLAALDYINYESGLLTVNLGTGRGCTVLEMVHTFEKVNCVKIPYQIVERRPGDIEISYADPSEAYKLLGWKARFSLDDMCRDAWRWQTINPNGYNIDV